LTLVLDRGSNRFTVVSDLNLSQIFCDSRVADCIWAEGGFDIPVDVNRAHALLMEIQTDWSQVHMHLTFALNGH
jgi:hypothetical protein